MSRQATPLEPSRLVAALALVSYLVACGALGVGIARRTAPLTAPDETYHFRRAVEISSGGLFARRWGPDDWGARLDGRMAALGVWLDARRDAGRPIGRTAYRDRARALAAAPPGRTASSFPSTASYSPVPYAGGAAGLAIARRFDPDPADALLAGRLAGLALALGLVGAVGWLLPFGGVGAVAILTTPTALVLSSGFSADPVGNALPLLFAALVLRLRAGGDGAPPPAALAALVALAAGIGLSKLTAAPLALAILLLPARRFPTRRAARRFRTLVIGTALACALAWNLAYPFDPAAYWHSGGDPSRAIARLVADPAGAAAVVVRNLVHRASDFWIVGYSAFGGGPSPYVFLQDDDRHLWALALLAAALASGPSAAPPGRSRARTPDPAVFAVLAPLAAGYALLVVLAFLIGYSPPGHRFVEGLQGRYFLLPGALLFLAIASLVPYRGTRAWIGPPVLAAWWLLDRGSVADLLAAYRPLWSW